jgi:hypothetical protein
MNGRPEYSTDRGSTEHIQALEQKISPVSTTKHPTNKTLVRIAIATALFVGLIIPWIAFLIWLAIVVIFGCQACDLRVFCAQRPSARQLAVSGPSAGQSQRICCGLATSFRIRREPNSFCTTVTFVPRRRARLEERRALGARLEELGGHSCQLSPSLMTTEIS